LGLPAPQPKNTQSEPDGHCEHPPEAAAKQSHRVPKIGINLTARAGGIPPARPPKPHAAHNYRKSWGGRFVGVKI